MDASQLQVQIVHRAIWVLVADSWTDRWVKSKWKQNDGTAGDFKLSAGKWYGDAEADKGIQTGPDSKFFASYAPLTKEFDNTDKDTVVQVCTFKEAKAVRLVERVLHLILTLGVRVPPLPMFCPVLREARAGH